MIGRLTGILIEKQPPHLLLDANGIAYEIEASMHTFYKLPALGEKTILHTHFVVREDAQLLFGFYELRERTLFRQLIKVNGVGPKLALTILSSIEPDEFARCIADNDSVRLIRLPGVGKKTAERLIIEMRDRLSGWELEGQSQTNLIENMTNSVNVDKIPAQEAISALISLGYKAPEAQKIVNKVVVAGLNSQEIIRLALKAMVR
jgi:Holliday junction DNA helicase RuvA